MSSSTFTITASPNTDIWRKPPQTDIFNAPTAIPATASAPRTSGPLRAFLSARVTFTFAPTEQYDQAGLLLSLRRRRSSTSPSSPSSSASGAPEKWIKTGVEYYYSQPRLSTVSCETWADWSVAPLGSPSSAAAATTVTVTILVEKEADDKGRSLWVYQVLPPAAGAGAGAGGKEEKVALREICWIGGDDPAEWEVGVEAMAARPEAKCEGELSVEFSGFEVAWS